jgi:hypothetical protein
VVSPAAKEPGLYRLVVDGRSLSDWTAFEVVGHPALRDDGGAWAVDATFAGDLASRSFRIVDGRTFGPFRRVGPQSWAPRGTRWYFTTDLDQGRGVVVDGRAFGPAPEVGAPTWDTSGTRLAFVFARGGSWFVWVDGREAGPFSGAQLITRAGAWIGYSSTDKNNRTTVVIAGKAYGPYDWVDPALDFISPDGKKWTSRVLRKGVWSLLDTGKETPLVGLSFQKLGDGYAYTWGGQGNWRRNIDGQTYGPYDAPSDPLLLSDGSAWAFQYRAPGVIASRSEQAFVQIQGQKPVAGWDLQVVKESGVEAFTWSSGGQESPLVFHRWTKAGPSIKTVYTPTQGPDGWTITAEGQSFGPYEDLGRPVVTGDGQHWGVVCRLVGGQYLALVDGVEGQATRPFEGADGLVLSANGASWTFGAWPTKAGDQQVRITNDQETGPFRWAGNPVFSRDGTHSFAWVQTLENKNQLVFDGQEYGPYSRGEDRHLFDVEAGRFVFGTPVKLGIMAVTDQGTWGPYQGIDPVSTEPVSTGESTGGLFGFVGTLKDGRVELRVTPGMTGGGKTYGPYRKIDLKRRYLADDGQDWILPFVKDGDKGSWFLQNGVAVSTDGFEVRPWGDGYLMMIRKDGRESLVRNGATVGSWTKILSWWPGRDGKTWVAEVVEGEGADAQTLVVINGQAQPGSNLVHKPGPEGETNTWFAFTEAGEGQVRSLVVR